MKYQKEIKRVAVYLRKSREDENEADTLFKHRIQLLEFVKSKGWEYEIYEEIGSSDTIDFRPKFSRLLQEMERGVYDAVGSSPNYCVNSPLIENMDLMT